MTQLSNKAISIILCGFFGYIFGFLQGTMLAERILGYPVCTIEEPQSDRQSDREPGYRLD
jgi:hypothetical protein